MIYHPLIGLVISPHSQKRQHTSSPSTSPKTKQSDSTNQFTIQNCYAVISEHLTTQEMKTDQSLDIPNFY